MGWLACHCGHAQTCRLLRARCVSVCIGASTLTAFLMLFLLPFFMFLLFVLFVQESPPTASPCTYSSPVRVALCGSIGNTHDFTIGFSFLGTLV
jgi:hypothetical protein